MVSKIYWLNGNLFQVSKRIPCNAYGKFHKSEKENKLTLNKGGKCLEKLWCRVEKKQGNLVLSTQLTT